MATVMTRTCDRCGKVVQEFAAELWINNSDTDDIGYCAECFKAVSDVLLPLLTK
jgi:hypothetical protein